MFNFACASDKELHVLGRELALGAQLPYFNWMDSTLILPLDPQILALAEQEAQARHTTVPDLVAHQLRIMARNWKDSRAGKTPVIDALRGTVRLPENFNRRATVTEELQKKHGIQG